MSGTDSISHSMGRLVVARVKAESVIILKGLWIVGAFETGTAYWWVINAQNTRSPEWNPGEEWLEEHLVVSVHFKAGSFVCSACDGNSFEEFQAWRNGLWDKVWPVEGCPEVSTCWRRGQYRVGPLHPWVPCSQVQSSMHDNIWKRSGLYQAYSYTLVSIY